MRPVVEAHATASDDEIRALARSTASLYGPPQGQRAEPPDRPGAPFLGTGEAAQGPTAAALGNAIRQATGRRLTDLPFRPARIKAARERSPNPPSRRDRPDVG